MLNSSTETSSLSPTAIRKKEDAKTATTTVDTVWWTATAESGVRITFAGFLGSWIGLAKERQQQRQKSAVVMNRTGEQPKRRIPLPPTTNKQRQRQQPQLRRGRRGRPPRPLVKSTTAAFSKNLPAIWSISCTLFAIILESCRRTSPTSILLGQWKEEQNEAAAPSEHAVLPAAELMTVAASSSSLSSSFTTDPQVVRQALTSFGDYTLGGTVAGLAGSYGQRKLPNNRILFGLTTGLTLGMLAGFVQAAIDVGNLYVEREKQQQQEEERRKQEEAESQDQDQQQQQVEVGITD